MIRRLGSLSGLGSGGGSTPADLTPPGTPAPVSLASGSTSLGSTSIGSWSASVTVVATVTASAGGAVTATVTGSGAGPYSVSIASGLANGRTYSVRLRGTAADGQVADVVLSAAVETPASIAGTYGWATYADYDFTSIDTGAGTTATSGTLALTVGGAAFLTLSGISGTGTGSIVPTNGQGIVVSGSGTRAFLVDLDWSALGLDLFRRIIAVEWDCEPVTLTASGQANAMLVSSVSGASSDSNFGARLVNSAGTYTISARSYNAGVANAGSDATSASLWARWSSSSLRIPEGFEVCQSVAALPANPDLHTYLGRRRSQTTSWGAAGAALTMGSDPRPAFSLVGATASSNEFRVRRLRVMALGVV